MKSILTLNLSAVLSPMQQFWLRVSELGLQPAVSFNTRKKIVFTNQLSFLMLITVLISSAVFAYFQPSNPLVLMVLSITLVPALTLYLNSLKYTDSSRLFLAGIMPMFILSLIVSLKGYGVNHGFQVSEYHYYTPRYFLVILSLLPLTLLDITERKALVISLAINVLCLLLFDAVHGFFGVSPEHFGFAFSNYYQATVMPVVMLFFLYGNVLFYQQQNKEYQTRIIDLMDEVKAHNNYITREIDLAQKVITHLLPQELPTIKGADLDVFLSWSSEVGGDYYTVKRIDDDHVFMMVADVSGKGLAASIIVSTIHSSLQTQLVSDVFDLTSFIGKLNEMLYHITRSDQFVTGWVGLYNEKTRELTSINSGHLPPVILSENNNTVSYLKSGSPLLGVIKNGYTIIPETVTLHPGEVLSIFTDGITEARSIDDELLGDDRLLEFLLDHKHLPSKEIIWHLERFMHQYTGCAHQNDDVAFMTLKLK